jgi:hypothetical protein
MDFKSGGNPAGRFRQAPALDELLNRGEFSRFRNLLG